MSIDDYKKITQIVAKLRQRCQQLESELQTLIKLQKLNIDK